MKFHSDVCGSKAANARRKGTVVAVRKLKHSPPNTESTENTEIAVAVLFPCGQEHGQTRPCHFLAGYINAEGDDVLPVHT